MMTSFAFILGLLPLVIARGGRGHHAPSGGHAGVRRHDRCIRLRDFHYSVALHNRGKLAPADPKPGNEVIAAPYALAAIRLADLSSETPSVPRNWIRAFSDWRK
jgi:hypothetical protein